MTNSLVYKSKKSDLSTNEGIRGAEEDVASEPDIIQDREADFHVGSKSKNNMEKARELKLTKESQVLVISSVNDRYSDVQAARSIDSRRHGRSRDKEILSLRTKRSRERRISVMGEESVNEKQGLSHFCLILSKSGSCCSWNGSATTNNCNGQRNLRTAAQ